MKRFLNTSVVLMVFVLLFSSGCESVEGLFGAKQKVPEPQEPEKFYWASDQEPIAIAPIQTVPPSLRRGVKKEPVAAETEMVAVDEVGSTVISRTYPWTECGIIQLDKTVPKEVELNRNFDYFIKVTNLTDAKLTDITVIEELSDNFDFTSASPAAKEEVNRLVWEIQSLGPKASKLITVSGVATQTDPLEHSTNVLTPIIPALADIKVVQPRLELTKTAPVEALLCEPIPVVFVVANSGTGSARNVRIIDTLPPGLLTVDGHSKLVFEVGTLAERQSRQYSAELRATKTGRYASRATASSSTGLAAQSPETTTVVDMPVLAITNNGPEQQYLGRELTYEITVANNSNIPAKNTVIEDTIPEGVTSTEASSGAKRSGTKLIWELGTLEPNSFKKVRVSYMPNEAGTLTNSAVATAYCSEAVTASVKTLITGITAVAFEVVDVDDPVKVGARTTYVISVTNQGSAAATNVRISCILEDNVQYVSSAGATAGTAEGRMVNFSPLSSLAPKAKAAWRVVVVAVKPGDVRFKVVMNADQLTRSVEKTEATHLYE